MFALELTYQKICCIVQGGSQTTSIQLELATSLLFFDPAPRVGFKDG